MTHGVHVAMTHGIRPPAAKEHTLLAHRTLRKGEFSVDIPRDLVTRHGPYKVLNPSEALLLAGICSLRPGKYMSKSRLFKAAGMDINQGRNVLARLVEKGFILEVGHSWTPVIPERDEQPTAEQQEQPTAEQPTAKKEKEERATLTAKQPQPARKVAPPVKRTQGGVSAANAPSPEELAEAWNTAAGWTGDAEYGWPVVQENVRPEDFTPAVINTLMFHASTNDIDPIRAMKSVVGYSNYPNCKGLDGKGPAFVIGTVTDNEVINQRFYDSGAATQRRRDKREEDQLKQWQADAPLREAEKQEELAKQEKYDREKKQFNEVILNAYLKSCEKRGLEPGEEEFTAMMSAKHPETPKLANLSLEIMYRDVRPNSPLRGRVYIGDEGTIGSEARHEMLLDVAEKLTYALCMMGGDKRVPTRYDLDHLFTDELDKVLEDRVNRLAGVLVPGK